jgi:hypothetical protein
MQLGPGHDDSPVAVPKFKRPFRAVQFCIGLGGLYPRPSSDECYSLDARFVVLVNLEFGGFGKI